MPKKVSCPSCGANLKPDSYYCDYCGAFFEQQKNELNQTQLKRFETPEPDKQPANTMTQQAQENRYEKDHFVSENEIENSKLNSILISYNNIKENSIIGVVFVLMFFSVLFSGAVFEAPFVSIIAVIILSNFINGQKEKKKELIKLYQKGNYEKAYQKLSSLPQSQINLNVLKQKILLCYYRLNKKEEAKTFIQTLNSKFHSNDVHIKEVADKLNITYEPKLS
jgi:hypothetical protein